MAGNMSSYGAYYYNNSKPESKGDESKSPAPGRYDDRPVTAATRYHHRRRSITPPDGERKVPYYQEIERPRNPGANDERSRGGYGDRPTTAYIPSTQNIAAPGTPQPARPQERRRADSPDPSMLSDISEPEIRPNYSAVDYYTYSKCLERVVSDPNLSMPVRLGVMGKWGAGKSKIIKGVLWCLKQACDTTCTHLNEPVDAPRNIRWMFRTCWCCDMSFFVYLFLLFILLLTVVASVLLAFLLGVAPFVIPGMDLSPQLNKTSTASSASTSSISSDETIALIVTVSLVACLLLIICIAGVFRCTSDRYLRGVGDTLSHFRALVVMALCDTPPPPVDPVDKVEIIPICFNASEFADSDDCWSALAQQMLMQCESMFGFWKSRLYRICSKDLEHEHDYLIADEEKWRNSGKDKVGAKANRSIASASPSKARADGISRSARSRRGYEPEPKKPLYKKSVLKTKSNKVVATEDNFDKKINVTVRTAKWKAIGYPMLITIGLSSFISATVILIIISQGVDTASIQVYHYVILALTAAIILMTLIIILRGSILLLHSACSSPEQRLERLRKKSFKHRKLYSTGSQGFMHHVKEEIVMLVGFLRYMEHIYQRRFRILLTIDDLDKCADQRILDTFNAVKVLFGEPSFPIVTMISMDSELVVKSLSRMGVDSGQTYINQMVNMKFCLPDSSQQDIVKLLENQAEHLLCSTSVRVNRLKEVSDQKYNASTYHLSRREAIRELDLQHDYEEKAKPMSPEHEHYYVHPVSARHVSTARSRRSKSSKSTKKRVVFTPLRSTSEDGLGDLPPASRPPPATIDKAVIPPVNTGVPPTDTSSPPESRRLPTDNMPLAADRPDSQLSINRAKPPLNSLPKSEMRRENSTLAEESSDEEQEEEEPDWMLAMSSGEARKDNSKTAISIRRPQLADSEKTEEQLADQHIHAVAEIKVMLGVSHGLITALVNNPSYELSISNDSGAVSIKNTPLHVNLQALSGDEVKRHILAYGLRRRMVYIALDEVRHNIKLLDSTFTRMSQLFNTVYLSIYIWVQKLKQLGIVDSVMDEKQSDKAIVKLVRSCQELTRWVMLCELWPYRSSWLIYKVERVNRKMGDFPSSNFYLEASIRDIYKDIRPDVRAAREDGEFEVWRQQDFSDTTFKKCLEKFKDISGLSILRYLPFTINIDRMYKNEIKQYMATGGGHVRTLEETEEAQQTQREMSLGDGTTSVAE